MSIEIPLPKTTEMDELALEKDHRWLLVQRITQSEGFQRAEQLRKILLYVSRVAILHPDQVLREYEIACDVLGRRQDFDPSNDKIVRAQFTHLRRKLERYFQEEGSGEQVALSIPKGSYIPVFTPVKITPPTLVVEPRQSVAGPELFLEEPTPVAAPILNGAPGQKRLIFGLVALAFAGWIAFAFSSIRSRYSEPGTNQTTSFNPAFLQFLGRFKGSFSVVVPDTSEVIVRMITGAEISPEDYSSSDFPQKQIASVKDPEVRYVLSQLALRRNTTASEAKVAIDLMDALRAVGFSSTFRYARDLHVRDFNQGNSILIGSQQSDPWVSLFTSQMNFRLIRDSAADSTYFVNTNPLPGEEPRYILNSKKEKIRENYGHIAMVPNSSRSGFVLLIDGSDMESGEAAANFLLHGQLTPEITALLARKDLSYFEIFLRGKHIVGESEDSLEVVSVRPRVKAR